MPPTPGETSTPSRGGCLSPGIGIVLGAALLLLSGGVSTTNAITNSQKDIPNPSEYGPVMWRNERADKLFPKTIGTKLSWKARPVDPKHAEWRRVGIAPNTSCDTALDGGTLKTAKKAGCKAVVRATYVDPTGNTVATIALIVLPTGKDATREMSAYWEALKNERSYPEVHALTVPGTVASHWKDSRRNAGAGMKGGSLEQPYTLAVVTGAVDGRKAGNLPGEWGEHDGQNDHKAWEGAAMGLSKAYSSHLGDLLMGETE